jgi:hypothetical protein
MLRRRRVRRASFAQSRRAARPVSIGLGWTDVGRMVADGARRSVADAARAVLGDVVGMVPVNGDALPSGVV